MTPTTEHTTTQAQPSTVDGTSRRPGFLDRLDDSQRSYVRFAAMIFTSMVVMYGVMYLNTYELSHVQWSETRMFMTFLMGASMAVIMLSFMWSMHEKKKVNIGIYGVDDEQGASQCPVPEFEAEP